jgi:hypothetical protein
MGMYIQTIIDQEATDHGMNYVSALHTEDTQVLYPKLMSYRQITQDLVLNRNDITNALYKYICMCIHAPTKLHRVDDKSLAIEYPILDTHLYIHWQAQCCQFPWPSCDLCTQHSPPPPLCHVAHSPFSHPVLISHS